MADVMERLFEAARMHGHVAPEVMRSAIAAAITEVETLRARLSQAGAGGGVVDREAAIKAARPFTLGALTMDEHRDAINAALAALAPSPSAEEVVNREAADAGRAAYVARYGTTPDTEPLWDDLPSDVKAIWRRVGMAARSTPPATPVQPTASVEAVARIDAMGVQPERSDTFHYQAAGYSQGWHAAIAAYRQGIRKLASLTSAPAQGGGEPDLIDQHFAAIAIASSIGGKKGWDWLRKYESGDDEHVAQARAFDGRAFAAPSPAPVSAPLRGEEHRIRDWLLKRHADHLSASADNRLMMRREFGDAEMFLDTAILLSELSRAAALSSPATPEPVSAPATDGEMVREAVEQVRYRWEVIQGQCSEGDGFTERAATDLEFSIVALEAALSNPAPGHGEAVPVVEPWLCGGCGQTDPAKRCLGCLHGLPHPTGDKEGRA